MPHASSATRWARRGATAPLAPCDPCICRRQLPQVKLLDVFERAVVLVVFGHFAFVMLSAGKAGVLSLILLASESLPVILILTRRAASGLSDQPLDWLLALIGTILPLLAVPMGSNPLVPIGLSGAIMLLGSLRANIGQSHLGAELWSDRRQPRDQGGRPVSDCAPPYLCGLHYHPRGLSAGLSLIVEPWSLFHTVGGSSSQALEGRAPAQTGSELSKLCGQCAISALSDDLLGQ